MSTRAENRRVLKDAMDASTLDTGGALNRQQFDEFFQEVQDQTQLLDRVRTVQLDGPEQQIDTIGVGERILRSATEGSEGSLVDVSTGTIDIDVEEVEVPFTISRRMVEDNIEGENVTDVILDLFGTQFAVDSEDLGSIGGDPEDDLTGDDATFAGINDGWLELAIDAGRDVVDNEGDGVVPDLFSSMLDELHPKYKRGDRELIFLISHSNIQAYKDHLADRETGIGDAMLMTGDEPTPFGYELVDPVGWPDEFVMLTQPENLVWAMHRDTDLDITTEGSKKVLERLWGIGNFTSRTDYQIEDTDGVVVAENVLTAAQ